MSTLKGGGEREGKMESETERERHTNGSGWNGRRRGMLLEHEAILQGFTALDGWNPDFLELPGRREP